MNKILAKKILYAFVAFCLLLSNIEAKSNSLTLFIIGDTLLHKSVYEDAKTQYGGYDFMPMFSLIAPISKKYDLAFYNQESILGGVKLGLSSYPRFNSPKDFGETMLKLGFNLISLANNHTLDKGEEGVHSMLRFWRNKESKNSEIYSTGSFESADAKDKIQQKILQKNGISYAMLAYTYGTNGIPLPQGKEYLVNVYTKEMLKNDIKAIRHKVDLLIVSIHWGVEYTHKPTKEQREIAHFLANLGVDIVIGNHPHAIQPIERIGNTLIFYALGNFLSGQVGLQKRVGLMASVQIDKIQNARENMQESTNNFSIFSSPKSRIMQKHIREYSQHSIRESRFYKRFPKKVKIKNVRADLVYTFYEQNPSNSPNLPKMSGFKIYPFLLLNDDILPNYQQIYEQYLQIIKQDWIAIGL